MILNAHGQMDLAVTTMSLRYTTTPGMPCNKLSMALRNIPGAEIIQTGVYYIETNP